MRWRVLLIGSLLLNVIFAVVLLLSNRKLEQQFARATEDLRARILTNRPQPAIIVRRQSSSWREVESPDHATNIVRLRDIGSSVSTVRDTVATEANQPHVLERTTEIGAGERQLAGQLTGAVTVRFDAQSGSKVKIEGTSSIHDWDMNGNIIGGYLEADAKFPEAGTDKATASVVIPVRTLKSYAKTMDDVMQEAMTIATFPRIEYKLVSLKPKSNAGAKFEFDAVGALTVKGKTVTNTMPVTIEKLDGGKLKITGTTPLKMTDFGVPPPCPALAGGLIKTGDDIKVSIEWLVAPKAAAK
jgi:polyisoprenoid-binding protein YceI